MKYLEVIGRKGAGAWIVSVVLSLFLAVFSPAQAIPGMKEIGYAERPDLHSKLQNAYETLNGAGLTEPVKGYSLRIADTNVVNAVMSPVGKVIICTRPLVESFTTEELSLVLEHEISHVKLGHYGKRVAVSFSASLLMKAIDMAVPGAAFLDYLINPAVTNTFSRSQEVAADLETVKAMRLFFGQSPEVYVNLLEKLRSKSAAQGQKDHERTGILDSHPNIDDRIAKVRAYAKKNNW